MRVIVDGVVQGVWFRQSTLEAATAAGVAGWVRNLPDGRVEAYFEGEPTAVANVVAWCRRGPTRAVVTLVEEHPEPPTGVEGFRIVR